MGHVVHRLTPRVAALMLGLAVLATGAAAQDTPEEPLKQIKLTEAQVTGFISAQPDLASVSGKLQAAGGEPDASLEAELETIAKKHGFSSFRELDDVAANISIIMAGLDAEGGFTDPVDALKKELESVEADASIPEEDKKALVGQLTEAIKTTPPLQHKENVDVVKTHREAIEKALQ